MAEENRGERGTFGQYARFYGAFVIAFFLNPRFLAQNVAQSVGQLLAVIARLSGRGSRAARPVVLSLPFGSRWKVIRGGVTKEDSHSWSVLAQRYACDFVKVDEAGRHHRGDGERLEAYLAFGEPVLAPADGVVVGARDGCRDYERPGTGWIDWRAPDIRGNHVIIQHESDVFSFAGHLRRGTVRVRVGDRVERGDVLGECGNSGHSTEPHIHFHVQDRANFYLSVGRPVAFMARAVTEAGEEGPPPPLYPTPDQRMEPAPEPTGAPPPPPPLGSRLGAGDLVSAMVTCAVTVFGAVIVVRTAIALVRALWGAIS